MRDTESSPAGPGAPASRPSRFMAIMVWIALALSLYGVAAVFGAGGLGSAVDEIPGSGFIGGLFVGLALFSLPVVVARAMGRALPVAPVFPRLFGGLVALGVAGMATIGLIAVLVDVGFLEIVVREAGQPGR